MSEPGADRPGDSTADPTIDSYLEPLDHEDVLVHRGRRSGLYTFVAVHSTVRGPSLGGCRMWGYDDARQALRDALRLSRAMTYKSAVADLPLGGGKGVIMTAPASVLSSEHRTAALLDFDENSGDAFADSTRRAGYQRDPVIERPHLILLSGCAPGN